MDVRAEILDYIKCNETTGALMLTGPWGCGKSFMIKQIANELNTEKKAAVAVISLFGLDNISAINNRVKIEYVSSCLGAVGKKVNKTTKGIAMLIKDTLSVAGTALPRHTGLSAVSQGISAIMSYDILNFIEIKNTVGQDDNERKVVIVFDDLERCGIANKKDLFGAINDLVENKRIKVIIIADEGKINEQEYKEYKEKFISRTICMAADYDCIVENIIRNYNETSRGYREFLTDNQRLLKELFYESKSFNIRTFKCILADFERVYDAWRHSGISTNNMKWALYSFGADVFMSKTPKKEAGSNENQSYSLYPGEKEDQYPNKGKCRSNFFTLGKWISNGAWDYNEFVEELKQKYNIKEESDMERFMSAHFWDLQQKDIDKGLPQAVSNAYDGAFSKDQLISLIGKIHFLRKNNISLPVEIDYKKMEDGLRDRLFRIQNGEVKEPNSNTYIEKKDVDDDAESLFNLLNGFDNRLISIRNRTTFVQYLSGDESVSSFSVKGLRIDEFDDKLYELFIEKYMSSDNYTKRSISFSLLDLFFNSSSSNQDNAKHTVYNFERLCKKLKEINEKDAISDLINKSLINALEQKIEQLSQSNDAEA